MWSRDSQIIGMNLLLGIGSNVLRDSTRKRNIENVVRVEVSRKRRSTVIVRTRKGIDRDPDQMKDRDSVATGKDRLKTVIVDTREVPAMKNNKNNVKNLKNQRRDNRPQVTKAIPVTLSHQAVPMIIDFIFTYPN